MSWFDAVPLSKKIYDKAKELGVKNIKLMFRGGSDEGLLDVELESSKSVSSEAEGWGLSELSSEVEEWAWSVYNYSGAGDGTDYGDTVEYNLEDNTVSTSEWHYVISERNYNPVPLKVEEDSEEDDKD